MLALNRRTRHYPISSCSDDAQRFISVMPPGPARHARRSSAGRAGKILLVKTETVSSRASLAQRVAPPTSRNHRSPGNTDGRVC